VGAPICVLDFFFLKAILVASNYVFLSYSLDCFKLTFIFLVQKVLAAHGAAKVSAYVTHGIFPNNSWEKFQHDNGGTYAYCLYDIRLLAC